MSTNTDPQPDSAGQLPEKPNPTGALAEGVVAPTQVVLRDEKAAAATLRDLASIGQHLQGAGVRRVVRGRALVLQQRLDSVQRELTAVLMEIQQKPKKTRSDLTSITQLSHAIGYLAGQQTASQHLMLEVENVSSPGEADAPKPLVNSFPAGAIVEPAYHSEQPTDPKPGA